MSRKYRDAPKSDMDSQREMLDALMGINRNHDREDEEILDFRDDRICKFHLLGMCPHEMFVNTKVDCGPCNKIHSEELKMRFEEFGDPHLYDSLFEREFNVRVADADRVIERARSRLEEEKTDEELNPDLNPDVIRIQSEIQSLTTSAEIAGENGDIDEAQEMMATVEELGKQKIEILNRLAEQKKVLMQKIGVDVNKKLRVCDVCGSYLSIFDSDKRLQDHFMGKQHIGFQLMRDTLVEIGKRREERRGKDESRGSVSGVRGSSRDRDRDRDRRSRGDSRDRDRARDQDRSRDRDRRGDSRDRGAGGERDRRRGDSRDRNANANANANRRYRGDSRERGRGYY